MSLILVAVLSVGCASQKFAGSSPGDLVALSFNVRYDNPGDGVHAWPHRRDRVAALIRFHEVDIAGLQEVKENQIADLTVRLPDYAWYGVGRDDGESGGEFVPIFYRRDRFHVEDTGTFWLSDTPEIAGSIGWDAALTRVVSWVRLRDTVNETSLFVFNAHFDHVGERARTQSATLLKSRIATREPRTPAILLGDFNAEPNSRPYRILTDSSDVVDRLLDAAASAPDAYGPVATFHGFEVGAVASPRRIDYIFLTPGFRVRRFGVLTDQIDGRYPSDHLPVLVELAAK